MAHTKSQQLQMCNIGPETGLALCMATDGSALCPQWRLGRCSIFLLSHYSHNYMGCHGHFHFCWAELRVMSSGIACSSLHARILEQLSVDVFVSLLFFGRSTTGVHQYSGNGVLHFFLIMGFIRLLLFTLLFLYFHGHNNITTAIEPTCLSRRLGANCFPFSHTKRHGIGEMKGADDDRQGTGTIMGYGCLTK